MSPKARSKSVFITLRGDRTVPICAESYGL